MSSFKSVCVSLFLLTSLFACTSTKNTAQSKQNSSKTDAQNLLTQAGLHLQRANAATTRSVQLKEVGEALQLYLQVEQTLRENKKSPSASLYQAIAASYLLIEKPGWAYFYNHQALIQAPRDNAIEQELAKLEKQMGVAPLVFPEPFVSYQELLKVTLALLGLAFLLATCFIWFGKKRLRLLACLCALLAGITLTAALCLADAAPLYGIVVTSTPLYHKPAPHMFVESKGHGARILPEGSSVEVLELSNDNEWLTVAIKNVEGQLEEDGNGKTRFYVPSKSVRLIEPQL